MGEITLPKLRVIDVNKPKKKKILLLSDDLRSHSGIGTMSKEFVLHSAKEFDWVQLGSLAQHPDHGKVYDESAQVNQLMGIDDAYVKIYCHTGYGNRDVILELIQIEKPDVILHFTDPRFWIWLYEMEYELRTMYKIPIAYYNIWDCPPAPLWNKPFYESCDLIMNITKQTHNLVKMVLGKGNFTEVGSDRNGNTGPMVSLVHHGINEKYFVPIEYNDSNWEKYYKFKQEFQVQNPDVEFVIFWNNRNAGRKQPGDVLLSYAKFCERIGSEKSKKVALIMHTDVYDPMGTDLISVKEMVCPNYKVIFSTNKISTQDLNFYYNLADVTLNIASNEGFGLSNAESMMAGTMIIANVTGGLQDQMRFEDETGNWLDFTEEFMSNHTGDFIKHGEWAVPVYPSNRSLQGSIATPYIFDDRCDFKDVAHAIYKVYSMSKEERKKAGLAGRQWLCSDEAKMTSQNMANGIIYGINELLKNWTPRERLSIVNISKMQIPTKFKIQ